MADRYSKRRTKSRKKIKDPRKRTKSHIFGLSVGVIVVILSISCLIVAFQTSWISERYDEGDTIYYNRKLENRDDPDDSIDSEALRSASERTVISCISLIILGIAIIILSGVKFLTFDHMENLSIIGMALASVSVFFALWLVYNSMVFIGLLFETIPSEHGTTIFPAPLIISLVGTPIVIFLLSYLKSEAKFISIMGKFREKKMQWEEM